MQHVVEARVEPNPSSMGFSCVSLLDVQHRVQLQVLKLPLTD